MSGEDILAARRLLRGQHTAALATVSLKLAGHPFATGVDYLTDHDGRPVFLVSALAEHTRNLVADARASILVENAANDLQASPRLTLAGEAHAVAESEWARLKARYLRYFPEAAMYFELDFAFRRLDAHHLRYVGGFGAARWIAPGEFFPSATGWEEAENELLDRFPTLSLVGVDCDGYDLRADGRVRRIDFPSPLADPRQASEALAATIEGGEK